MISLATRQVHRIGQAEMIGCGERRLLTVKCACDWVGAAKGVVELEQKIEKHLIEADQPAAAIIA